jgi:hypothetical protein
LRAATTLEPKSLMLVLSLGTLYFLHKRNWLGAGAFAAATGLAWQIGWGYLIVVLLLAIVQGGESVRARTRAFGLAFVAACVVFGAYALYFVAHDALRDMLQQTFIVPSLLHDVPKTLDRRVFNLARTFTLGYGWHSIFGILGLSGLLVWLAAHLRPLQTRALVRRIVYFFLRNRRTAGVLLGTFGFVLYSFIDFQGYADWIPLLAFVSIFAAWVLWQIVARLLKFVHASPQAVRVIFAALALIIFALSSYRGLEPMSGAPTRDTWQEQQRAADELNAQLGADARVWLVGKADTLFFLRRVNVNKYIYLFGRVDGAVDALEPGGFPQMVKQLLAQRPTFIVLARVATKKFASRANAKLIHAIPQQYTALKACRALAGGKFLVRPDLADQLFPQGAEGCLKR